MIELHGGRIWVESEEGKGSKFIFTVPSAQPQPSAPVSDPFVKQS
jgi:signal transduction histidine kinase